MASISPELQEIADQFSAEFGSLSPEQINWKPNPESWSVGQCLEHLILTNTAYFPQLDEIASGNRQNSFWQQWSPFTGMGGRFLINALRSDEKKYKVPSQKISPPSEIDGAIVTAFLENQKSLIEKTEACANADIAKTVLSSPFMGAMTQALGDVLTIFVEHEKRHFRQAQRVMQAEGFPK